MNFIIEIIKKENGDLCYVVRAQNGFPLTVCDSLQAATDCIQKEYDRITADSQSKS